MITFKYIIDFITDISEDIMQSMWKAVSLELLTIKSAISNASSFAKRSIENDTRTVGN